VGAVGKISSEFRDYDLKPLPVTGGIQSRFCIYGSGIAAVEFDRTFAQSHASGAMTRGGLPHTIASDHIESEISGTITAFVGDVVMFSCGPVAAFAGAGLVAQAILGEEPG
jgi:hypothetical protein